ALRSGWSEPERHPPGPPCRPPARVRAAGAVPAVAWAHPLAGGARRWPAPWQQRRLRACSPRHPPRSHGRTQASPLFHVEQPQSVSRGTSNRGRRRWTAHRRGYALGHGAICANTWNLDPTSSVSVGAKPTARSGDDGHRASVTSFGGSETMRRPPTRRNGAPHSATAGGGPKLRATTPRTGPRSWDP